MERRSVEAKTTFTWSTKSTTAGFEQFLCKARFSIGFAIFFLLLTYSLSYVQLEKSSIHSIDDVGFVLRLQQL